MYISLMSNSVEAKNIVDNCSIIPNEKTYIETIIERGSDELNPKIEATNTIQIKVETGIKDLEIIWNSVNE